MIEIEYIKFSKTRDTVQAFARLVSLIKAKLISHQKNWEEFSLTISPTGFTTGIMPIETPDGIKAFQININLIDSKLCLYVENNKDEVNLHQSNIASFTGEVLELLKGYGINSLKPEEFFYREEKLFYDDIEAEKLYELFKRYYFVLSDFKNNSILETSNVNLWPHHFDISLLVFSGKLIDGADKLSWENSREQMNFGFSLGDAVLGEPYFYITAYPFNKRLFDYKLPQYALWQKESWNGLVITYSELVKMSDFKNNLTNLMSGLMGYNFTEINN